MPINNLRSWMAMHYEINCIIFYYQSKIIDRKSKNGIFHLFCSLKKWINNNNKTWTKTLTSTDSVGVLKPRKSSSTCSIKCRTHQSQNHSIKKWKIARKNPWIYHRLRHITVALHHQPPRSHPRPISIIRSSRSHMEPWMDLVSTYRSAFLALTRNFNSKNPWNSRSERAHEPPKLLASPANAVWHFTTATSINATGHERRHESEFTANDWWGFIGLGLAAVTSIATIDIDEWSACARNSRSSGSHTNATGWALILLYILKILKFQFSRNYITNNSHNSCVTAASNKP